MTNKWLATPSGQVEIYGERAVLYARRVYAIPNVFAKLDPCIVNFHMASKPGIDFAEVRSQQDQEALATVKKLLHKRLKVGCDTEMSETLSYWNVCLQNLLWSLYCGVAGSCKGRSRTYWRTFVHRQAGQYHTRKHVSAGAEVQLAKCSC